MIGIGDRASGKGRGDIDRGELGGGRENRGGFRGGRGGRGVEVEG